MKEFKFLRQDCNLSLSPIPHPKPPQQRFQLSWFDWESPAFMCYLPPTRFLLDSPDLSWNSENKGKIAYLKHFLAILVWKITLFYPITPHQVSPLNTATVSKCSKCCLRQIKFAKFPGAVYPQTPLKAHTWGACVSTFSAEKYPLFSFKRGWNLCQRACEQAICLPRIGSQININRSRSIRLNPTVFDPLDRNLDFFDIVTKRRPVNLVSPEGCTKYTSFKHFLAVRQQLTIDQVCHVADKSTKYRPISTEVCTKSINFLAVWQQRYHSFRVTEITSFYASVTFFLFS